MPGAFDQFSPGISPSNRPNGNQKVLKKTTMPDHGVATWDNQQDNRIKYEYQEDENHRSYFKRQAKAYNPKLSDDVFTANNIGKNGTGTQNPNNRVTQQILNDDPQFTNSWTHGSGGAEGILHRGLTEMGDQGWLKQFTSMANNGIMNSIMGLLSGQSQGSGGGGSTNPASNTGIMDAASVMSVITDKMGDLTSAWNNIGQNAINAAQNQNDAQTAGIDIPQLMDITVAGAVANLISNTVGNTVVSSITTLRAPM